MNVIENSFPYLILYLLFMVFVAIFGKRFQDWYKQLQEKKGVLAIIIVVPILGILVFLQSHGLQKLTGFDRDAFELLGIVLIIIPIVGYAFTRSKTQELTKKTSKYTYNKVKEKRGKRNETK